MINDHPKYKQKTGVFAVRTKKDKEEIFFVIGVESDKNNYQVIIFDSQYSCFISNKETIKQEYEYLNEIPFDDKMSIKMLEQFNNVNKIQIVSSSSLDDTILFKV